jgi:hypothetical protein
MSVENGSLRKLTCRPALDERDCGAFFEVGAFPPFPPFPPLPPFPDYLGIPCDRITAKVLTMNGEWKKGVSVDRVRMRVSWEIRTEIWSPPREPSSRSHRREYLSLSPTSVSIWTTHDLYPWSNQLSVSLVIISISVTSERGRNGSGAAVSHHLFRVFGVWKQVFRTKLWRATLQNRMSDIVFE